MVPVDIPVVVLAGIGGAGIGGIGGGTGTGAAETLMLSVVSCGTAELSAQLSAATVPPRRPVMVAGAFVPTVPPATAPPTAAGIAIHVAPAGREMTSESPALIDTL
jgi:hypothetical protein